MAFLLAHDCVGAPVGAPTVLVAHGILGNRGNWRSFSRRLAEQLPGWCVVTVDLRHHGDSRNPPPPDTVAACGEDLAHLADHLGVAPQVTIGHSFGGKVVLAHAARFPSGLASCWVLDAPPGPGHRGGEDHEVLRVLAALRDIPLPLRRREQIVDELLQRGLSRPTALWMTTNLLATPEGYVYRFDLDGVERLLRSYFEFDGWPVLAGSGLTRFEVVRAQRSDRWDDASLARFQALDHHGATRLHTLPDAGHWLHADNPDGLLALMRAHWVAAAPGPRG